MELGTIRERGSSYSISSQYWYYYPSIRNSLNLKLVVAVLSILALGASVSLFHPGVFRPVFFTLSRLPIALLLALGLATSGCQDNIENLPQQPGSTVLPMPHGSEVAVVRGLTMGDRACYMELEDAQGQRAEEEASFELCEQVQLIGQHVRLTRVLTPILAMSCQGDPECTQRDTVNLITVAEVVLPEGQSTASAALVSQLYERFPAPLEDTPISAGESIIDQDREVLTQFFDSDLTNLILADRACVAQNGGVCRLDFDPIWDSQDPTAYEFEVHPTKRTEIVKVRVQAPRSSEDVELEYRLVQEGGEWRIADISYPEGFTLRELLDTSSREY